MPEPISKLQPVYDWLMERTFRGFERPLPGQCITGGSNYFMLSPLIASCYLQAPIMTGLDYYEGIRLGADALYVTVDMDKQLFSEGHTIVISPDDKFVMEGNTLCAGGYRFKFLFPEELTGTVRTLQDELDLYLLADMLCPAEEKLTEPGCLEVCGLDMRRSQLTILGSTWDIYIHQASVACYDRRERRIAPELQVYYLYQEQVEKLGQRDDLGKSRMYKLTYAYGTVCSVTQDGKTFKLGSETYTF